MYLTRYIMYKHGKHIVEIFFIDVCNWRLTLEGITI